MRIADTLHAGSVHLHGVDGVVRQPEVSQQHAAVRMRIRTHAPLAARRQRSELGPQPPVVIEEFARTIAAQPALQLAQMLRVLGGIRQRYLMRPECSFVRLAIDRLRSRPTFRRGQYDHRPIRPLGVAVQAGIGLNAFYFLDDRIERRRHRFVHRQRLVTLDKVRRPSVTAQQLLQFIA